MIPGGSAGAPLGGTPPAVVPPAPLPVPPVPCAPPGDGCMLLCPVLVVTILITLLEACSAWAHNLQ